MIKSAAAEPPLNPPTPRQVGQEAKAFWWLFSSSDFQHNTQQVPRIPLHRGGSTGVSQSDPTEPLTCSPHDQRPSTLGGLQENERPVMLLHRHISAPAFSHNR